MCKEVVGAACYDFMRIGFDTLVTTPLDMSLNTTPCVSCGRCAETCPTGALMPKPRVLEKYDVDESRCILCGICVDACPYDALRCGPDFELSHESRAEPMIDLMAISAMDRDTEITYVRGSATGSPASQESGRPIDPGDGCCRCCRAGLQRLERERATPPATATRHRTATHTAGRAAAATPTTSRPADPSAWPCPPPSPTSTSRGTTCSSSPSAG